MGMGYVIIGINKILEIITMKVVKAMGCQTESSELQYIAVYTFIAQLMNTGFLVMLANANLGEQRIALISQAFITGSDPDFNNRWFISVGDIIVQS